MAVKASYLIAAGGGAILLWSGVRGKAWTTVFRDLLKGKSPKQISAELSAYEIQTSPAAFGTGGASQDLGVGGSVTKNKAIARVLAAPYGWSTGRQWEALDQLWTQESNWDNHAKNLSSGAYGIPQALPASKMGALANPPTSSASTQIVWGLRYVRQRYGDPVRAEAHEQANGWY